jgi:hypothetical protein
MKKALVILAALLALVMLVSGAVTVWGESTKTVYVKQASLDSVQHDPALTDMISWQFNITGVTPDNAPQQIYVEWNDGSHLLVNIDDPEFPGNVAKYTTSYVNPGTWVVNASAEVHLGWDVKVNEGGTGNGEFVLSHVTQYVPGYPTPELPAIALLGIGLAGVGSFVIIKRRRTGNIQS